MENRKRGKAVLLLAGVCTMIAGIIIGSVLIVQKKSWSQGGKGTKSPYQWKEDGKELTLSFDTSKLGQGVWEVEGNDSGFFEIQTEENNKTKVFYLTGESTGEAILEFSYRKEDGQKLYRMFAVIEVSDSKVTMAKSMARDSMEKQTGGEDTQNPFTYVVDDEGALILVVSNVEEKDWQLNQEEIPFDVVGPIVEDSTLTLTIRKGEEDSQGNVKPEDTKAEGAKATLKLMNETLGASIVMELEIDTAGQIAVKAVEAKGPSKEEMDRIRKENQPTEILTEDEISVEEGGGDRDGKDK